MMEHDGITARHYGRCPKCASKELQRSRRKNLLERAISPVLLPWRCNVCYARFFSAILVFRQNLEKSTFIGNLTIRRKLRLLAGLLQNPLYSVGAKRLFQDSSSEIHRSLSSSQLAARCGTWSIPCPSVQSSSVPAQSSNKQPGQPMRTGKQSNRRHTRQRALWSAVAHAQRTHGAKDIEP